MFGKERIKRDDIVVYLKNGNRLMFQAEVFTVNHREGRCTGWNATNMAGAAPFYIDPAEIAAVTIQ